MKERIYHCPPGVQWVTERGHTLVIDPESGASHRLFGLEAAIWDWLMLGYGRARLRQFVATALDVPADAAARRLGTALDDWRTAGLLRATEGADG